MLTPSRTSKLNMKLIAFCIKLWWLVASLIAHFIFFVEWIVELLTQSKIESNWQRSSDVPKALADRPPMLTYEHIAAATVWLKICVAYFTFISEKPFGCRCFSVNFGAVRLVIVVKVFNIFPCCNVRAKFE